jgi:hypothetical protein
MISETHHVEGYVDQEPFGVVGSYGYTDNHPVSGSTYYKDIAYAYSRTGLLQVQAGSFHYIESLEYGLAHANADATWIFQPNWSTLRLEIDVYDGPWDPPGLYWDDPILVEIEDITDSTHLFHYSGPAGWFSYYYMTSP